jgi:outer membrane protein
MKRLPLILSIISLAGVIVLFVFTLSSKPQAAEQSNEPDSNKVANGDLRVAYIQTDSLLVNYQLAVDLNNDFMKRQSEFNDEFSRKRSAFERDAVAFQEKLQRGGFLTEERAMSERDRLVGEEQNIQRLDYELSQKLAELEQNIQVQLIDSIVGYVKEFNKKHNYSYIFSNNGNIIVGDPHNNLTKEILEDLNARYAKSKKK